MVDDDESDVVETKIGVCEQESGGLDEDLDEDQYYNRNEGTYMGLDTHSEEPDNPDTPPGFASNHVQHVNVEQVPNNYLTRFI